MAITQPCCLSGWVLLSWGQDLGELGGGQGPILLIPACSVADPACYEYEALACRVGERTDVTPMMPSPLHWCRVLHYAYVCGHPVWKVDRICTCSRGLWMFLFAPTHQNENKRKKRDTCDRTDPLRHCLLRLVSCAQGCTWDKVLSGLWASAFWTRSQSGQIPLWRQCPAQCHNAYSLLLSPVPPQARRLLFPCPVCYIGQ